jgi:hypothetical protein
MKRPVLCLKLQRTHLKEYIFNTGMHETSIDFIIPPVRLDWWGRVGLGYVVLGKLGASNARSYFRTSFLTVFDYIPVTVTVWYRMKIPMHGDHFLIYCTSPSEF